MRVGLLGPLLVTSGDTEVRIGGARLRALLTRLALEPGAAVSTGVLAQDLWPRAPLADPAHALRALVSRLRRSLPEPAVLEAVPGGYRLRLPETAVDVARFERLRLEGGRLLRSGDATGAGAVLRQALELWRGEPLADVADLPFAAQEINRLAELRLSALEDRAEADLARGAPDLVADLEGLTAAHLTRERLHTLLVRALHADGRHAEALRVFARYREHLADQLGTEPGPDLRAAHLAVLRDEKGAEVRSRGNLPAPLTTFVGRESERERIHAQLREQRLVTLVGPGGVGKTRLATTVAAEIAAAHGVWLVPLATVTDAAGVVPTVANAMELWRTGLPEGDGPPADPVTGLARALAHAEAVLVVDNCEHVIDEAARVIEGLLAGCPKLRIIATSREPLAIPGEALCPVPPLPVPPPGVPATADYPSVRLFLARAKAVQPRFTEDQASMGHVAEICRRLDGLPLAIELACVRLRSLSVEHLAIRLDDRFRLLTGGSRTALSRHQTLHAVVTWSWDLLDDDARRALRALAVFSGPFTAAAAEAVGVPPDLLDVLLDRSLIEFADHTEPRYRLLETIREYALQRLVEAGEVVGRRQEHAAYFLALVEQADLRGPDQRAWLSRLNTESGNLLAALRFATDSGDADTAIRMAAALWYLWAITGEHADAARRLRAALAVPGPAPAPARRAAAVGLLFTSVLLGAPEAKRRARELAADLVPGGPLLDTLFALTGSGAAALPEPEEDGPWERSLLWWVRSFAHAEAGEPARACHDLTRAADGFRAVGDRWALAMCLLSLADTRLVLGGPTAGLRALEESADLVRGLGANDHQRLWLAIVRLRTGDVEGTRRELLDVVDAVPAGRYASTARIFLGDVYRQEGAFEQARAQLWLAAADEAAMLDPVFGALLRLGSGHLAAALGEVETAVREIGAGLELVSGLAHIPMGAAVGAGLACLLLRAGAPEPAARVLGASRACAGTAETVNRDVVLLGQQLRARLGERAYAEEYAKGRELRTGEALAFLRERLAAVTR